MAITSSADEAAENVASIPLRTEESRHRRFLSISFRVSSLPGSLVKRIAGVVFRGIRSLYLPLLID